MAVEKSIVSLIVYRRRNSGGRRQYELRKMCITRNEDAGVFLRRWGAAALLAVPSAHLPGQTAEAATGQTPRPAETTSAKQAQHSRSGHTDPHTLLHIQ